MESGVRDHDKCRQRIARLPIKQCHAEGASDLLKPRLPPGARLTCPRELTQRCGGRARLGQGTCTVRFKFVTKVGGKKLVRRGAHPRRHCERSVAIHEFGLHGLPRRCAPRSDETGVYAPFAVSAPKQFARNDSPPSSCAGARLAPASRPPHCWGLLAFFC